MVKCKPILILYMFSAEVNFFWPNEGVIDMDILCERLKRLRKNKSITQEELGKQIGVLKTTISNYENGYSTPDAYTLTKIAKFYNVSIDFILGMSNSLSQPKDQPYMILPKYPVYKFQRSVSDLFKFDNVYKYLHFSESMTGKAKGEIFGLYVEEDIADFTCSKNGCILACRKTNFVSDGDLALLSVRGKAVLGRVLDSPQVFQVTLNNDEKVMYHKSKDKVEIIARIFTVIMSTGAE